MYRVLTIGDDPFPPALEALPSRNTQPFGRRLGNRTWKPLYTRFAHHVKHLAIVSSSHTFPGKEIVRLVQSCRNVHDLAMWVDRWDDAMQTELPTIISKLPLRRLSISLAEKPFPPSPIHLHAFAHVTHLDVGFIDSTWPAWEPLSSPVATPSPLADAPTASLAPSLVIPKLTHLWVSQPSSGFIIRNILHSFKSLKLLVVVLYANKRSDLPEDLRRFESDDRRLVFMLSLENSFAPSLADWQAVPWKGVDYWHTAEGLQKDWLPALQQLDELYPPESE